MFYCQSFKNNSFSLRFLTVTSSFSRGQNAAVLPQENHQPAADRGSAGQVRVPRGRLVAHRSVVAEGRRAPEGGRRVLHAVRRQHGRAADQPRRDEALRRVRLRGHQQRGLGVLQSQAHPARCVQRGGPGATEYRLKLINQWFGPSLSCDLVFLRQIDLNSIII